jgi:hypothetical protein
VAPAITRRRLAFSRRADLQAEARPEIAVDDAIDGAFSLLRNPIDGKNLAKKVTMLPERSVQLRTALPRNRRPGATRLSLPAASIGLPALPRRKREVMPLGRHSRWCYGGYTAGHQSKGASFSLMPLLNGRPSDRGSSQSCWFLFHLARATSPVGSSTFISEPSFGARPQSAAIRGLAVSFAMATTFGSTCKTQQSPADMHQSVVAVRRVRAKAHKRINRGFNVVQRPGRLTMNLLMLRHSISPLV